MKKICILYTNPGAGHKSTAEALCAYLRSCKNVQISLVNFAEEYDIKVFKNSSKSYAFVINNIPWLQKLVVKDVDASVTTSLLCKFYSSQIKKHIKDFVTKYPADVYVSTNYFDNELFKFLPQRALKVMLIVDIVYPLRIWFSRHSDLIILPTNEMLVKAQKYLSKVNTKHIVMGLPIKQEFFNFKQSSKQNSLESSKKVHQNLLFFGGGEGDVRLLKIVKAVDALNEEIVINVVCGKNKGLKKQFEKQLYKNKCNIYGWVENFPELLKQADILVTKAGPTIIWEALTLGKSMILYGSIPGVEEGNVEFAQKYSNAVFEKKPAKIAELIRSGLPKLKNTNIIFQTNWAKEIGDLLISKAPDQ